MKEIKVALFGVTGYAANYTYTLAHPLREGVKLVAAVDPFSKQLDACPVYDTAEEMFKHHAPDLCAIATPIHLHAEQAIECFNHGCSVALEKPIAADTESAKNILKARDEAGKLLSVGFNLCAESAIREVKRDVDSGLFGKPLSFKSLVLWPRDHTYFNRSSGWAGKKYSKDGKPIFDSVLSNATAHYLMNMLFMAGKPMKSLDCRTYRANPVETYDTALMKGITENGVDVFIAVSHAVEPERKQNPLMRYDFENAYLTFGTIGGDERVFEAHFKDGRVKRYEEKQDTYQAPFWNMIDALRGEDVIACSGETALMHVDAVEKMRFVRPESLPFPKELISEKDGYTFVPGLADEMFELYERAQLPDRELRTLDGVNK